MASLKLTFRRSVCPLKKIWLNNSPSIYCRSNNLFEDIYANNSKNIFTTSKNDIPKEDVTWSKHFWGLNGKGPNKIKFYISFQLQLIFFADKDGLYHWKEKFTNKKDSFEELPKFSRRKLISMETDDGIKF